MSTNYEVLSVLAGGIQHEFDRGYDALFVDAAGISGNAPVASLVSPASGVLDAQEAIVIDVTDTDSALRRVFLVMRIPAFGLEELVHQGDRFTPDYARSTRVAIVNGFRYTIRRAGGWPASPVLDVYPIDVTGQEG
jgi:hypothetical protein